MSTADLSLASAKTTDENVADVVHLLMAPSKMDAVQLAPQIGMTKSTLYSRLSGKGSWTASELAELGRFFAVRPDIFFVPVEEVMARGLQNWK